MLDKSARWFVPITAVLVMVLSYDASASVRFCLSPSRNPDLSCSSQDYSGMALRVFVYAIDDGTTEFPHWSDRPLAVCSSVPLVVSSKTVFSRQTSGPALDGPFLAGCWALELDTLHPGSLEVRLDENGGTGDCSNPIQLIHVDGMRGGGRSVRSRSRRRSRSGANPVRASYPGVPTGNHSDEVRRRNVLRSARGSTHAGAGRAVRRWRAPSSDAIYRHCVCGAVNPSLGWRRRVRERCSHRGHFRSTERVNDCETPAFCI